MVAAAYFPSVGGVETHVHEVARRLPARGIRVQVLTTDRTGNLPVREVHDGIEVHRVRAFPAHRDWRFAPGIDAAMGAGRWDIIHCQGYHTFVAPLALAAAWRRGVPSMLTFHSGGPVSSLRSATRTMQLLVLRPLVRHARALIAVSDFERRTMADALHLSPARFVVLANGSELPSPVMQAADDGTLLVSVGRLVRYKGHHRVIAAMPAVLRSRPDARLEIIGAGPEEAALRRQVAELGLGDRVRIRAIPGDDRQAMADLLARANLVVLLSDYESQGIAALEALTLGRRVLVSDATALAALVGDGMARGVSVDASSDAVADAVLATLGEPPPSIRPAAWTWDDCADRLADLYQRLAVAR
jgi:glycosyltransferase involved in cell wall biosynthesis